MNSSSPTLPLIARAEEFGEALAISADGLLYSYADLLDASKRVAQALLAEEGRDSLFEEGSVEARVAFLAPPSFEYTALQWGVWRAGGIAVPLSPAHPPPELQYVLDDTDASIVVAHPDFLERLAPICRQSGRRLLSSQALLTASADGELPAVTDSGRALILYTSGTTSRPKGVVWTHRALQAQVETLSRAWGWRQDDSALLVLPLHHVHGIFNVLTTALWNGALCRILPKFDPKAVWSAMESGEISVFMAVPTLYYRLLAAWDEEETSRQQSLSQSAQRLRLMVSGSAALPVQTLERWREVTGHTLLERYGMTEIGMALSNPLEGERLAGAVGRPLPGVDVRLVDGDGLPVAKGQSGEIEVKGAGLFSEYWRRQEATQSAFRSGGWFRTGDVATEEDGIYRILGRESVDIIKSGGYKISALEVEAVLRDHPGVTDCAVVGLPDPEWGERVAVAVICRAGKTLELAALRDWARERLAPYKLPSRLLRVEDLPRNALGKVTKPAVKNLFD